MASPPLLVVLGLTLPDSRVLNGIAGIGLTLANVAIILPYLRQPILDSMHAHECPIVHEQSTQTSRNSSQNESNVTQLNDKDVESPILGSSPPCDREHQSPPLVHRFTREGRSALQIPLPVPDELEIAFFNTDGTTLSIRDLGEEHLSVACEQNVVPKKCSMIEVDQPAVEKGDQRVSADLPSVPEHVEIGGKDLVDVIVPVEDENVVPTSAGITDPDCNSVTENTIPLLPDDLTARGDFVRSPQARPLVGEKEAFARRRPESLAFVPQSVIRRYPSAPMAPARHCFGHQTFCSGLDHQAAAATLPHVLIHNPAILLEGTRPQANYYTTSEGHWRASFTPEARLIRPPMGQTFVIAATVDQRPLQQELRSRPEPPTIHKPIPLTKHPIPTRRRRLGVLSRAALRDRRFAGRRRTNEDIDDSSSSSSDSDSESIDSQYSSGSSANESMLPHILGADLIAAIDANSESELNLLGSKRTIRTPGGDFLVSEDSVADVSMIMHLSTRDDDTSNGEVGAPATIRALTYEDIQQWASGVVQKCARQVCRNREPVEPLSPSQVSDVCAEKPSSSGISQCPLSGLHCKLGAAASAEVPVPRPKEPPVSHPPTSVPLTSQKLLQVRNLRDIPEFVPRRKPVSVITENSRKSSMRSTTDAATKVIARMESNVGFQSRQHFAGMERRRMVSTAVRCP